MLQVQHLRKSYGAVTVISDVSFILNDNQHVGLIGPNGAGKSTLLRCIIGAEPLDAGTVVKSPPGLTIGYLAQAFSHLGERSVGEVVAAVRTEVLQAERALPMPTRYTLSGDPAAPMLHVVADRRSAGLLARLEDRATAHRLAVSGIALVEDPAALPTPCRLRADLREHSFETSRPQRRTAPATTTLDAR